MRAWRPGLILGVIGAAALALASYSVLSSRQGRDAVRFSLDNLRAAPWLTDSYRFEHASPHRGLDAARIAELSDRLAQRDTKSFLILRDGRIVHERYGSFHGRHVRYLTASLAKALVGSMALLLAIDSGWINLDEPAWHYIPAWRMDPWRSAITVRDLANHSSGIEHARPNEPGAQPDAWQEEYWIHHEKRFDIALKIAPVAFPPGSATGYSGPAYAALSYALAAALRSAQVPDLEEMLRVRIMRPLGVPDSHWSIGYGRRFRRDGLTLYLFEGGGRYTARAAARLGQLIADRGTWEGRELLRKQLIDSLFSGSLGSPAPRPEWEPVSAVGWWSNAARTWPHLPDDTLVGAGSGHQILVIVPSQRLVVVRQGGSLGGPAWGKGFWQELDRQLLKPLADIIYPRPPASI